MDKTSPGDISSPKLFDISDNDILEAMKAIPGYLDITPQDFKILYVSALKHAFQRLTEEIKAKDVMTAKVIFVQEDCSSREVAKEMAAHDISGLPVVNSEKKVVGIISEKDFLLQMGDKGTESFMDVVEHCLSNKGCLAITMRQQKARDIMRSPAITVSLDTPVSEIAHIFTEKKINRAPVTDEKGNLSGIVARADIVQSSLLIKTNPDNPEQG